MANPLLDAIIADIDRKKSAPAPAWVMQPLPDMEVRGVAGRILPSLDEIRNLVRQNDDYQDGVDGFWVERCPGCYGFLRGPLPGTTGLGTCQSCGGVVGVDTQRSMNLYVPTWWAKRPGPHRATYFDVIYPTTATPHGWTRTHGWFQRSGITQIG